MQKKPQALDLLDYVISKEFQHRNLLDICSTVVQSNLFKNISKKGIETGSQYGGIFCKQFGKECKENKEVLTPIASICTKSVGRWALLKSTATYGLSKGTTGVNLKTRLALNGAGLVLDGGEAILEFYGFEKAAKRFGLFGNIAIGAGAGLLISGYTDATPAAVSVGMATGFGLWLTGRSINKGMNKMLSD